MQPAQARKNCEDRIALEPVEEPPGTDVESRLQIQLELLQWWENKTNTLRVSIEDL